MSGRVEVYRGQRYELLRREPHMRRDSTATTISIWSSQCWQCGQPYECTTSSDPARFKPSRRCEPCRATGHFRPSDRFVDTSTMRPFAPVGVYDERGR